MSFEMTVAWTMTGPKGFMVEGSFTCNSVADIGRRLMFVIHELDGEDLHTWTEINLEVVRADQ